MANSAERPQNLNPNPARAPFGFQHRGPNPNKPNSNFTFGGSGHAGSSWALPKLQPYFMAHLPHRFLLPLKQEQKPLRHQIYSTFHPLINNVSPLR
ncbi:hypothetical protein CKAN_00201200 [Cinnamomum micranthum f. kanehirae]|uniref:Uncharacterized protein n=1 Tax=Cinnamomum micranthum f. kanehirae TaxID=337451 RepID=A0A443N5C2_9MAGN|nr:hypothetical protein CKAN_00201200 [Cinnamomum micranthum f. kanehirae]